MKKKLILVGLVCMTMLFTSVCMADDDYNDDDLYDIFGNKVIRVEK